MKRMELAGRHPTYLVPRFLLLGMLVAGAAMPAYGKVVFPSVRDLNQSPDKSYVLGQMSPVFGASGLGVGYSAVIEPVAGGKSIRIDLRCWRMPDEWWNRADDLDRALCSYGVAAVMCYPLQPGRYRLIRYSAGQISLKGRWMTSTTVKVPLNMEFEVTAGKVVYVGSCVLREVGPTYREGEVESEGKLVDDFAGVVSVLDVMEPGLGEAVEARAVRAESLKTALQNSKLVEAATRGDVDAVRRLLAEGADINANDNSGHAALHSSAGAGKKDVVELLLANGADVNAKDKDGRTALHWSAAGRKKDMVELLLGKGADVNARASDGESPLHEAAFWGWKDVAELLLANGADVNARASDGESPLHKAAFCGRKEVTELLLAKGADVNARASDGESPLHTAAFWGRKEVAELLLANGADINAKDNRGSTPLASAEMLKREELARLLREHGGAK